MKLYRSAVLFITTLLMSNLAIAGIPTIIVGSSSATAVPTLSGYMLIILSLLLMVFAFRMAKSKNIKGTPMMLMSTIGVAAIISASGGIKIVSDAYADGSGSNEILLKINGGFKPFLDNSGNKLAQLRSGRLNVIENNSTESQKIKSIDYFDGCSLTNAAPIQGTQECKVGDIIDNSANGLCYVDCRTPISMDTFENG